MDTGRENDKPRAPAEAGRSSAEGAPRGRSAGTEKDLAVVCKKCGNQVRDFGEIKRDSACPRCGQALHSCLQCSFFDSAARWECSQHARIPARIAAKSAANDCPVYAPAASFDLTGRKASDSPSDARKAFDALFKK
jgi:hypothetical protein